jgi:hypothetical protein
MKRIHLLCPVLAASLLFGCAADRTYPPHDRPFPVGQVTDAHWETQQTNAEASDFVFFEHEFVKDQAALAPGGKRHLEQLALRLDHVPFPVVIEQTPYNKNPQLDAARRKLIVENLARLGMPNTDSRVVIANAFPEGRTSIEAQGTYFRGILMNGMGGGGMGGGGGGGTYR